jgi:hypothetical protein
MFSLFVLCLMAELIAIAAQGVRIACLPQLPNVVFALSRATGVCICALLCMRMLMLTFIMRPDSPQFV